MGLYRSVLRGNVVDPPARVSIEGASVVPSWPQAASVPDGRTLLGFVAPDKTAAFLAVDDGSGLRFRARPLPNLTGELRGVLAHVGTTKRGSWVVTHQTADASWAFRSYVQVSTDGERWTGPVDLQPADPNVHDAFPIARLDDGADVYYLRAGARGELNVHRRSLSDDGTLGPEQVVTAPGVGHVNKPQPRRLPDGRLALMLAIGRASGTAYDLAMVILDGDAPR